jgi:23S rRNA (cytidine1920-2'-O)/16S rRNA (cytidine1409-2'-O)-methyltransferase
MTEALRLDQALVARGLADTIPRALGLIAAGEVLVDECPCDKPATRIRPEQAVRLRSEPMKYVSRGGLKLKAALDTWPVPVEGRVCVDLGASTGGFTDCLLQRGARRVYAIDVGYGQLAWKIRQDPRVVVMERTNARHVDALAEPATLLVADLSFISLTLVLPTIRRLLAPEGDAVLLIKPQFEVGRADVGKGGLVRDDVAIATAVEGVLHEAQIHGFGVRASRMSPLTGAKAGNREWLVWLGPPASACDIVEVPR